MVTKKKVIKDKPMRIKPKSPEMEALLQAGYSFTIQNARRIVKEYEAGATHLMEKADQAKAMIAAYESTAKIATSTRKPWSRSPQPQEA